MDRSLVVTGKSIEQALDKAAVLLHCDTKNIGYEIMQEGKSGRNVTVPFKLRVTAIADFAKTKSAEILEEEAELTPNLPWLANTLAPLFPDMFCKALEEAFQAAVSEEFPEPKHNIPVIDIDAPILEIPAEAIAGSRVVDHKGDVRIYGDIKRGVMIKAAGKVQIVGEVDNAYIEAGGDVGIAGGLLGTVRSLQGNVAVNFIQGGRIEAPFGDIYIKESCIHSEIHAGMRIRVGENILGGTCYGEQQIKTNVAGSNLGAPTNLISGINKRIQDDIEKLRKRVERHTARIAECDRLRSELLPVEERGEELPIEDRVRLWHAAIRKGRIHADLRRLAKEKSRLLGIINTERNTGVCVKDRVYPKVKIIIDDAPWEVKKETQYVKFTKDYDQGIIRINPYM